MCRLEHPVPLPELKQRLRAAVGIEPLKKKIEELEIILELLGPSNKTAEYDVLKRDILFKLHKRIIKNQIHRGISKVKLQRNPIRMSLCSTIVEYQQQQKRLSDQALNNNTEKASNTSRTLDHFINQVAKQTRNNKLKLK